tara:strand:- start:202 stop:387 length:186 start_codon:yes stop_codon:yes gene_type:complete
MKYSTYFGLGFITIVLIMQRWDYSGLGLLILGVGFCIPEIVEKIKISRALKNRYFFYKVKV